jgi:uncharacterized protein YneF (UPF0154 family)
MDTVVNVAIVVALIVGCFVATKKLGENLQRSRTMRALSVAELMKQMVNHSHLTTITKLKRSEVCCACDATQGSHCSEKNQQCCCKQQDI